MKAAGAKTVRRLFTSDETHIDYVFSPPLPPGESLNNDDVVMHVRELGIPIVNVDWVVHVKY